MLGFLLQAEESLPVQASLLPAHASSIQLPATLSGPEPVLPPIPVQDVALPDLAAVQTDAVQSMGSAREHGDARQPQVQRDAPRELPTAQELADPAAYQRYEARQSQRLHRAYVQAADTEIPRLQQDIEQARAQGMSPEQLAEGEEKLRRIQAMRDQLQAGGASAP